MVGTVGILFLYYWHSGKEDIAAGVELDHFRQAMFSRCGGDRFSGETDPKLTSLYADSSRMRTVVVQQFHLLEQKSADCADVTKALRSVDFPIRERSLALCSLRDYP